jgi:D-threo-aldose 1-dehydrogenase
MNPDARRQIGNTALRIPVLGLGGSSLGGLKADRPVSDAEAQAAYEAAWDCGFRYFDTAPLYGAGQGERRLGRFLQSRERDSYVVSTKVGNDGKRFDYGYDATLRSVEKSLARLATDRLDLVFIHDIDPYNHGTEGWWECFRQAMEGAYKALDRLKSEGVITAFGVGVNSCEVCVECLRAADFDVFMLAARYTLLDRSALNELLPACEQRGATIISAAPFNSGILASGARCNEGAPTPDILKTLSRIKTACTNFGVSLGAAALHFPLRHPGVGAVTPGPRTVEQVRDIARWFAESIPEEFWRNDPWNT